MDKSTRKLPSMLYFVLRSLRRHMYLANSRGHTQSSRNKTLVVANVVANLLDYCVYHEIRSRYIQHEHDRQKHHGNDSSAYLVLSSTCST